MAIVSATARFYTKVNRLPRRWKLYERDLDHMTKGDTAPSTGIAGGEWRSALTGIVSEEVEPSGDRTEMVVGGSNLAREK